MIVNHAALEEAKRHQQVTVYDIIPRQSAEQKDYQVLAEDIPSSFKEDCRIIQNKAQIAYWVEEEGKAWCKIPKLLVNTPQQLFALSGNPSASVASDDDATFEFFDDFEGVTKLTDGTASISYTTGKTSQGIELNGGSEKKSRRDNDATLGQNLIYEVWIKIPTGNSVASLGGISLDQSSDADAYGCIVDERSTRGDLQIRKGVDTALAESAKKGEIQTDTWYFSRVVWKSNGLIDFYLYNEDETLFENISVTDSTYTSGKVGLRTYDYTIFDTYKVRKYASPEPLIIKKRTSGKATAIRAIVSGFIVN